MLTQENRNAAVISDKRVHFGWFMYDWANSAFAVTILSALFGPYLDKVVVPETGYSLPILGIENLSATSLYGYTLGISALLVLLSSPVLGAIADYSSAKKKFMMFFCYLGSLSCLFMFFIGPGDVLPALILFFISNFSFVSANVFYDAFLPHIAPSEEQDIVSGKGYAYGYAGGGILFVFQLLLVQFHDSFGISDPVLPMRLSLAAVGFWWGGFAIITFSRLREERVLNSKKSPFELIKHGFARIIHTAGKIKSLKQLLTFLIAFMIYNDGIQTVIAMATIYGSEELNFSTSTLMGCLLMVQVVGMAGARLFAGLATRIGTKQTVLITLAIWSGVVIYAYYMTQPFEFWILGAIAGMVLGGSQALSRSLYSKIIPPQASAEFFGFFSVFEKFSAIGGPIVFAFVKQVSGSARNSIIALIAFFLVGFVILLFLNMKAAEEERIILSRSFESKPE